MGTFAAVRRPAPAGLLSLSVAWALALVLVPAEGPAPARAAGPEAPAGGRQWAILIGIGDYQNEGIEDLHFTLNDVKELRKTLIEGARVDPKAILELDDSPDLGDDRRPTKDNIETQVLNFVNAINAEKPGKGDSLLFYYSGHGTEEKGAAYLVPSDARKGDRETYLKASEIGEILDQCGAEVKFLILDTCHAAAGKGLGFSKATGGRAEASETAPASQLARELRPKTYVVLESCSAAEESYEWEAKRQSIFTYWLCHALRGAADLNGDGRLTTNEVYNYLEKRVPKTSRTVSRATQSPRYERSGEIAGDPVVLKLDPVGFDPLCRRLADQIDDDVRCWGLKSIRLGGEFKVKDEGGQAALASFQLPGTFAQRIARELRDRAQGDGAYQVLEPPAPGRKGPVPAFDATVYGELYPSDRGIGVQCDLRTKTESLVRPSAVMTVTSNDLGDLGQSGYFPVARKGDRPAPGRKAGKGDAPARPVLLTALSAPPGEVYPLDDPDFPFNVQIIPGRADPGAGVKVEPAWLFDAPKELHMLAAPGRVLALDPRSRLIVARPGERFLIRLARKRDVDPSRPGQDALRYPGAVGVKVQIDGFPVLNRGAGRLERERLEAADGWIWKPENDPLDIKFWQHVGARADEASKLGTRRAAVSWFEFTEASQSITRREPPEPGPGESTGAAEKIGLITVAFYAEKEAGEAKERAPGQPRGLGVGAVGFGTGTVTYEKFAWGNLLAVVQIGYADQDEIERKQLADR